MDDEYISEDQIKSIDPLPTQKEVKAAPVKTTSKKVRMTDSEYKDFLKLVRTKGTTPEQLSAHAAAIGKGGVDNAAQVLAFARNPKNVSNPLTRYWTVPEQEQITHFPDELPVEFEGGSAPTYENKSIKEKAKENDYSFVDTFNAAINSDENEGGMGGWGLSPETRAMLGDTGTGDSIGGPVLETLTDAPANIADLAYRVLQAGHAGTIASLAGVDEGLAETGALDLLADGTTRRPGLTPAYMALSQLPIMPESALLNTAGFASKFPKVAKVLEEAPESPNKVKFADDISLLAEKGLTESNFKSAEEMQAAASRLRKNAPTVDSAKEYGTSKVRKVKDVEEPKDVVTRLTEALNTAGSARKEQEILYKEERARRVAQAGKAQDTLTGEEAVAGTMSALKGQLPKADFEGVANQFSKEDINNLLDKIRTTETLSVYGKATAYEGFQKLMSGVVPNPSELSKLSETFPTDFIKAALKNKSNLNKSWSTTKELWNLPKSLMSTADLSGLLRQGIGLAYRPKEFANAAKDMHSYFLSEKNFKEFEQSIKTSPNYAKMEEAGLSLPGAGDNISQFEDAFNSHILQKIPGIGAVNKASERAYVGVLNKLRTDNFNSLLDTFEKRGLDIDDPHLLKSLGKFINTATGRGDLGKFEAVADELNMAFFSPRMLKARFDTMLNPMYYKNLHPEVRKEAFKSAAGIGTYWGTMAGLAGAAGFELETDPTSSDFMKAKDGNIRLDFSGGFGPQAVLAARLLTKEAKSLKTGDVRELERSGDKGSDAAIKFLRTKLSPSMSLLVDAYLDETVIGQEFKLGPAVTDRLMPMGLPDIIKTIKIKGAKGIPYAALAIYGSGLQVFDANGEKTPQKYFWEEIADTETDTSKDEYIPEDQVQGYTDNSYKSETDTSKDEYIPEDQVMPLQKGSTYASDYIQQVFPDAEVTSTHRDKDHPLSIKARELGYVSQHEGYNTTDIKPMEGISFEDFLDQLEDQGVEVDRDKSLNEVGKGRSAASTGDHWHIVLKGD